MIEKGYTEFKQLANDLNDAKKERVKVQYYTGTGFIKEKYRKTATEFLNEVVIKYIKQIEILLER